MTLRVMTTTMLMTFISLGAAAIALWVDARFPRLAPPAFRRTVLHVAFSLALLNLAPFVMKTILADSPTLPRAMVSLFALLFPALTYSFLSGVWTIRLLQGALPRR